MNNALTPEILTALSAVSLQCVECSALYPGLEVGSAFRYRCNCGGTLDVEMKFALPEAQTVPVQAPPGISSGLKSDSDPALLTGTLLRQLFDERASTLPAWSISAGKMLLDYSGVWRYRELILPAPEQYIISRPEGNTGLYPVGMEMPELLAMSDADDGRVLQTLHHDVVELLLAFVVEVGRGFVEEQPGRLVQ